MFVCVHDYKMCELHFVIVKYNNIIIMYVCLLYQYVNYMIQF